MGMGQRAYILRRALQMIPTVFNGEQMVHAGEEKR
jgi:hypothetical protein